MLGLHGCTQTLSSLDEWGLLFSRGAPASLAGEHRPQGVVVHGPSCISACGVFLDQGSNLCFLNGQVDSYPLLHQASLNQCLTRFLTSAPLGKSLSTFLEMIHVVRAPFLVWTWPLFLCLELHVRTPTCAHTHAHTCTLCRFRRRGCQAMHWGDREEQA